MEHGAASLVTMATDFDLVADRLIETGRQEAVVGISGEPEASLATLRFADHRFEHAGLHDSGAAPQPDVGEYGRDR